VSPLVGMESGSDLEKEMGWLAVKSCFTFLNHLMVSVSVG